MMNLELVFPEIFLSLSIMFLLLLGVFKKKSSKLVLNISLIVLLIIAVITFNETMGVSKTTLFSGSIIIDYLSSFMKIITLISAFSVLVISTNYLKSFKIFKIEYPILILSSVLGMMIMISSNDLIVFYMGLELQSLALYVLATFNRDQIKSSEAGLKYFVLSALSSGLLLYGCSLLYGFTGSTNFELILKNTLAKTPFYSGIRTLKGEFVKANNTDALSGYPFYDYVGSAALILPVLNIAPQSEVLFDFENNHKIPHRVKGVFEDDLPMKKRRKETGIENLSRIGKGDILN